MKKRPFCIAEIGGNHEGSFDKACELVALALETPVDCIKFQTYFADSLVAKKWDPDRWNHFKRFELTIDQHIELAKMVTAGGKSYLTSIWDQAAYKALQPYLDFVKIGSGDLNCYSFLKTAAETELPIILSTGLSTYDEVRRSVELIRSFNPLYQRPEKITLLQCSSVYPLTDEEANLAVMETLAACGTKIGYSDHTIGSDALKMAAIMGAEMLEFHFSDDSQNAGFRDHLVSLEQDSVTQLYAFFDRCIAFYGSPVKKPTPNETDTGHLSSFRRGTYTTSKIIKGTVITEQHLIQKRPCNAGLDYENLLGRTLNSDIDEGDPIREGDLITV